MASYSIWVEPRGANQQCIPSTGLLSKRDFIRQEACAGGLQQHLQVEVRHLATVHQGPVFQPHVTLLGGIMHSDEQAVLRAAHEVARELKVALLAYPILICSLLVAMPQLHMLSRGAQTGCGNAQDFRIRFDQPSASTTYHQCVFILCRQDAGLERAAGLLRQKYGMSDLQDFMPHLSLLYSDMDQASR